MRKAMLNHPTIEDSTAAKFRTMADSKILASSQDWKVHTLKVKYPVSQKYEARQKTTHGRVVPYEAIIPSLYRANAFCQCVITSEERVHKNQK